MGTTGETSTLSTSEQAELLEFVKQKNAGAKPLVLGFGGNNTEALLQKIPSVNWKGVDAVLSVSPYYNKPSQMGIVAHYTALANALPVPVIMYNVPGRTMSNMSAATTLELAKHKNIIAIKEASGNLEQCIEIAAAKPADFLLISGDDMLTVPMISIGGCGAISVLANSHPKEFSDMVNCANSVDYAKANSALHKLLKINPLMYEEGNPVGVKALLEVIGIGSARVRLPLAEASESLKAKIKAAD
jgi:4-hydroxy-tetrahydrodipicolinate synthase